MRRNNRARTSTKTCLIVATVVATLAVSGPVSSTSAAVSSATSTYVLYAGHGVGVVATENPLTGCGGVFLSTDFTHWRNITPPVKSPGALPKGQCAYVWSDAYFASSMDGWLVGSDGADADTILRHTLNGGRSWTAEPGEYTGSAGGGDTITFDNATLGWRQQFGYGSNGHYALQRTENGECRGRRVRPTPRDHASLLTTSFHRLHLGSPRFLGSRLATPRICGGPMTAV